MTKTVLRFPQKSRARHGTLAVFTQWQPGAVAQTVCGLLSAGDRHAHSRLGHCIVGKLEEVAMLDDTELKTAHSMIVLPQYATAPVLQRLLSIKDAEIYPFDRLEARITFYIRNTESTDNDKTVVEQGSTDAVIQKIRRWRELGPEKLISIAAESSTPFATSVCGRGKDAPFIYVAFGIQTIDSKYLLDIENLKGPYTCAYWGNKYVAMPHALAAKSVER